MFGTISIRLNLTWVWLLASAAIVIILVYAFAVAEAGERPVYLFIATALGILTGIFVLVARLDQSERQLEQARRTAALGFIHALDGPQLR